MVPFLMLFSYNSRIYRGGGDIYLVLSYLRNMEEGRKGISQMGYAKEDSGPVLMKTDPPWRDTGK